VLNKALTRYVLAALSLSCAGCVSAPPEVVITGRVTVTGDPTRRPNRARAGLANEVTVILPPAGPGGYVWRIAQHSADTLKQLTDIVPAKGGTGESTIAFLALRSGLTRLMFTLVPPAEQSEVEPAGLLEIHLTIE
jgi:hypothetical protein